MMVCGCRNEFVLALKTLFSLALPEAQDLGKAPLVFAELQLGWDVEAMLAKAVSRGVLVSVGKAPPSAVRVIIS